MCVCVYVLCGAFRGRCDAVVKLLLLVGLRGIPIFVCPSVDVALVVVLVLVVVGVVAQRYF